MLSKLETGSFVICIYFGLNIPDYLTVAGYLPLFYSKETRLI
jgi:hypothetical protein